MLLRPSVPAEDAALAALLDSGAVREVHDRLDEQLEELVRCTHPSRSFTPQALSEAVERVCGSLPLQSYGTWVWYPWSARLVRVLPREEFRRVRTDRNRDKITRAEQEHLLTRRIGVIGLSVGNSAALTCAMEGLAGSFRLADHDRLGLSNLNRLRAGVHELGVDKTVLCARQLYELDPYLDVEIHPGGLTEESADAFFGGEDGLDLLVEECDTPWAKVAAREYARRLGVPVLMDANDRGLLDVERFDLEPDRPLFHGRAGDVTSDEVRDLDRAGLVDFLVRVVDENGLSPAMRNALDQLGRTLSSWPQLASGVALGGALVADTARRVLLGQRVDSGRYYVDLEALVAPDRAVRTAEVGAAL
ncbi:ThiF family adenylyltransferase [Streptomyces sp. NPDC001941]|uniref:ThiF family adenylyltransferase n=1 Tax=Streptomyces sp. NPDC001941 TaxID=3154659 RepID=UPI003320D9F5